MEEKIFASIAYLLIVAGVLMRKNRRIHPVLMSLGIAFDFSLVIVLQVQRSVIQDAMTETYNAFQWGHIAVSTMAVVLYVPVLVLGIRQVLGKGSPAIRRWHIRIGSTAFALRSAGFVLMFSM